MLMMQIEKQKNNEIQLKYDEQQNKAFIVRISRMHWYFQLATSTLTLFKDKF